MENEIDMLRKHLRSCLSGIVKLAGVESARETFEELYAEYSYIVDRLNTLSSED